MKNGLYTLLLFFPLVASGQFLSKQQLDTARVYKDLDEALANPESVYVLHLNVRKGKIPAALFQLENLHVLVMKRGRIERLPDEFAQMEHLINIDLTNNRLDHFPPVFLDMPQLREVHLGKNEIQRIPEDITRMRNLRVLDIWSNLVPRLPLAIAEMEVLEEIDMRMIEVSQAEQDYLKELLPEVELHFSVPCNCR